MAIGFRILDNVPTYHPAPKGCLFRMPESGKRAIWQVTNICNYGCKYCVFASGPRKISGELSTERSLKLLEELRDLGFTSLKITGGEPLVRRDIAKILMKAREVGLEFDLSSNVSLLTPQHVEALSQAQPRYVHVSLDGAIRSVQEQIRGPGSFEGTVKGLKLLRKRHIPVRIGVAVCTRNLLDLSSLVERSIELGALEIVLSVMDLSQRKEVIGGSLNVVSPADLRLEHARLQEKFKDQIKVSCNVASDDYGCLTCPGGKDFLYIDNLGRVAPCTWAVDRGIAQKSERSLREYMLDELLEDRSIRNFSQMARQNIGRGCPVGEI